MPSSRGSRHKTPGYLIAHVGHYWCADVERHVLAIGDGNFGYQVVDLPWPHDPVRWDGHGVVAQGGFDQHQALSAAQAYLATRTPASAPAPSDDMPF